MSGDPDSRRVVVTGVGALTGFGPDRDAFRKGVMGGLSAITELPEEVFPRRAYPCAMGSRVPDIPAVEGMDMAPSRSAAMALTAATYAIRDSGVAEDEWKRSASGLVAAIGWGGFTEQEVKRLAGEGWEAGQSFVENPGLGTGEVFLADALGMRGPVRSCLTACAASTQALAQGAEWLREGGLDFVLAGGADSRLHVLGLVGYGLLGALASGWEGASESASRPFDVGRKGFVPGEGAGFILLETAEHAKKRGAKIRAELAGWAFNTDAYRITDPEPSAEQASACIRKCLERAGVDACEVDWISAHGTSTQANDAAEAKAIEEVFGACGDRVAVTALKSAIGHLSMASGVVETVAAILAMEEGWIPGILNLERPDFDLNFVKAPGRAMDARYVLKNSFGFGGQNACLLIRGGGASS